jgi:hypothetical protein
LERVHALKKRSLGCRRVLGRRVGSRRHRSAILHSARPLASGKPRIRLDLNLRSRLVQTA